MSKKELEKKMVKIRKTTQLISPYLYNALQIQPQVLIQITSNSYAAELQNFFFFKVTLGLVRFR